MNTMYAPRFTAAAALVAALCSDAACGFTASPRPARRAATALFDAPPGGDDETSYFQMQQIPTATSGDKLDHIVACSEHGACDVAEMMTMIDELEDLNAECQGALSRECSLDAVAARNVLKVALASQVTLTAKVTEAECVMPPVEAEGEEDPYASMADMEDECPDGYVQAMPSATGSGATALDRIVACAETADAACDVDEMLRMVEELEQLNLECQGALSRECSLDAVTARNILKVALASKALQ